MGRTVFQDVGETKCKEIPPISLETHLHAPFILLFQLITRHVRKNYIAFTIVDIAVDA